MGDAVSEKGAGLNAPYPSGFRRLVSLTLGSDAARARGCFRARSDDSRRGLGTGGVLVGAWGEGGVPRDFGGGDRAAGAALVPGNDDAAVGDVIWSDGNCFVVGQAILDLTVSIPG